MPNPIVSGGDIKMNGRATTEHDNTTRHKSISTNSQTAPCITHQPATSSYCNTSKTTCNMTDAIESSKKEAEAASPLSPESISPILAFDKITQAGLLTAFTLMWLLMLWASGQPCTSPITVIWGYHFLQVISAVCIDLEWLWPVFPRINDWIGMDGIRGVSKTQHRCQKYRFRVSEFLTFTKVFWLWHFLLK